MELKGKVEQLLFAHEICSVIEIAKKDENRQFFEEEASGIITFLCSDMKEIFRCKSFHAKVLRELFDILAEKGNPKNVLEALVKGITSFSCNDHLKAETIFLYCPTSIVLRRIPGKRGKSLEHILSLLYLHVTSPDDDESVAGLTVGSSMNCYLNFFGPLIEEVSLSTVNKSKMLYANRIYQQREMLQRYLIKLFCQPFLYHERHEPTANCETHLHIWGIFVCLEKICSNVYNVFDLNLKKDDFTDSLTSEEDDNNSQNLAFASLAYLIFDEGHADSFKPYVYQHRYLFKKLVHLVPIMWQVDKNILREKGFLLLQSLIQFIGDRELTIDYFPMEQFHRFSQWFLPAADLFCCNIVDYSTLVALFLDSLDYKRCYDFLLMMLKQSARGDVHSIAIYYYCSLMERIWRKPGFNYFIGKKLEVFLQNCMPKKDRNRLDVLYEFRKILHMSELINLFANQDPKRRNETGFWSFYPALLSELVKPLLKSLDYTKAYYKKNKRTQNGFKLHKTGADKLTTFFNATAGVENTRFTPHHFNVIGVLLTTLTEII